MKPLLDMDRTELEYKFSNTMGVPSYEYFVKAYSLVTTEDLIRTIEEQQGMDNLDA